MPQQAMFGRLGKHCPRDCSAICRNAHGAFSPLFKPPCEHTHSPIIKSAPLESPFFYVLSKVLLQLRFFDQHLVGIARAEILIGMHHARYRHHCTDAGLAGGRNKDVVSSVRFRARTIL